MSDDQTVCPLCGMGRLQPVAQQPTPQEPPPTTPQPPAAATPANAWAPPGQQAPNPGAAQGASLPPTQAAAPILSPDGYWRWDGAQWVPNNAAPQMAGPGGYPPGPMPTYGAGYGAPPRSGTNGLAIASLVLGILWIFGLGAVLAVIFGHVSKRQIRDRGEGGGGLATAGLILGYLGIAGLILFIITAATAASSLHTVVSSSQDAQVRADLRNTATAEESFLTDNGQYTTDLGQLESQAFYRPSPFTRLAIATDGRTGYCIVGSFIGNSPWFLYDSQAFGLSSTGFGSLGAAESACSDSGAGAFVGPMN